MTVEIFTLCNGLIMLELIGTPLLLILYWKVAVTA